MPKATWRIMGAGDSGEMPIVGDFIYPELLLRVRSNAPERYEVDGGTRIQRAPLASFLAAVRDIRQQFRFTVLARRRPNGIKQIGTNAKLAEFARRSEFHRYLVKDIRRLAADLEDRWREYMRYHRKEPNNENWILGAVEVAKGFEPDDPRRVETLNVYAKYLHTTGRHKEAKEAEKQARADRSPPP